MGSQADFDYDAFAELVLEDQAHLQAFMDVVGEKGAAERLAEDEERFSDRGKMRIGMVDECNVTTGPRAG